MAVPRHIQKGYMCKYCELFSNKLDKSTPYVKCGAQLGSHSTRLLAMHSQSQNHNESVKKYTICQINRRNIRTFQVATK